MSADNDTDAKRDLDQPIWGGESIAQEAGCTVKVARELIVAGVLDVTKIEKKGNASPYHVRYVTTPRRIRKSLGIND
jgi:hypothetical protein